ncbi:DJ-1/PfpI family protein [Kitasatospora aburaviensis]
MKAAVLVLDGAFDSGLSAVLDVLHSANALSGQLAGARPPRFDIRTVGVRRLVRTGLGHRVDTEGVAEAEDADILVVPALMERRPETLVDLVGSTAHRVARRVLAEARERRTPLATSCTGTFLLAESGVLDGLTATTSWWLAPVFRERYRRVTVDESRMVTTSDGVTTAGAAFGHLDLALAIVRMRSPHSPTSSGATSWWTTGPRRPPTRSRAPSPGTTRWSPRSSSGYGPGSASRCRSPRPPATSASANAPCSAP